MRMLRGAGVGITIGLSALLIVNALPYFTFESDLAFLVEKGSLVDDAFWRSFFYGHVFGAMVCLIVAPFLFWNRLLLRAPNLHRVLGRVYGVAVLGWAGPSGLFLSLHAKGGAPGKIAFLLLGVLWWGSTAQGIRSIVARRAADHRRWMIRSYSFALSAVSFRVFQAAFFWGGMADEPNYVLSLWLSLAASLAGGELFARRSSIVVHSPAWKGGVS